MKQDIISGLILGAGFASIFWLIIFAFQLDQVRQLKNQAVKQGYGEFQESGNDQVFIWKKH
jgi:hypothetical protein